MSHVIKVWVGAGIGDRGAEMYWSLLLLESQRLSNSLSLPSILTLGVEEQWANSQSAAILKQLNVGHK